MIKRIAIVGVLIFTLVISQGLPQAGTLKVSDEQLLISVCGGQILGVNSPPELIPELRAAAANALAERVMQARAENVALQIDNAPIFEAAALGPNPECRALGPILLPQIYVDFVARPDNPLVDASFGIPGFVKSVLFPPDNSTAELLTARTIAFANLCRGSLYGGSPSSVIARLESIASGHRESFSCNGQNLFLDGSHPGISVAITDSLIGAYLSQLGALALAPEVEDPV